MTLKTESGTHFEKAVTFVLKREGGLVDDPDDSGGLTNMGISKRAHPELSRDTIRKMSVSLAKQIYKRDYWDKAKCDLMPYPINLVHFDISVNSGPEAAAKILQGILGLNQDGIIGPKTLAAIAEVKNPLAKAKEYIKARQEWYKNLALDRPKNIKFLKGWLNRMNALLEEIEKV